MQGAQGPQGIQGNPGLTGPQGPSGDVTGATPVQLCPNDTAQYPEQGLLIGSSLYAVYYGVFSGSPQAFLAKLSPGNYVTTNGSPCAFTVHSNGSTSVTANAQHSQSVGQGDWSYQVTVTLKNNTSATYSNWSYKAKVDTTSLQDFHCWEPSGHVNFTTQGLNFTVSGSTTEPNFKNFGPNSTRTIVCQVNTQSGTGPKPLTNEAFKLE